MLSLHLAILLNRHFLELKWELGAQLVDGTLVSSFDIGPEELILLLRGVKDGFAQNLVDLFSLFVTTLLMC